MIWIASILLALVWGIALWFKAVLDKTAERLADTENLLTEVTREREEARAQRYILRPLNGAEIRALARRGCTLCYERGVQSATGDLCKCSRGKVSDQVKEGAIIVHNGSPWAVERDWRDLGLKASGT